MQTGSIILEGQIEGEPQHVLMGVYELVVGKEVNRRGAWQNTGAQGWMGEPMFMYYCSKGRWNVGERRNLDGGASSGYLGVSSTALTPVKVTETWGVGGREDFHDAPKMSVRAYTAEEKRIEVERLEEKRAAAVRKEAATAQQQQQEGRVKFGRVRGSVTDVDASVDYTVAFGRFATVAAPTSKAGLGSKIFYEFEVLKIDPAAKTHLDGSKSCYEYAGRVYVCSSSQQAGFASDSFDTSINQLFIEGVGDDECSWGIDGARLHRWHGGRGSKWGETWAVGDVIGCAADLVNNAFLFSRNGKWQPPMGCAFKGDAVTPEKIGGGVFPAISAQSTTIRANFGEREWQHGPPDGSYRGAMLHGERDEPGEPRL
jgi:hypothetical protein